MMASFYEPNMPKPVPNKPELLAPAGDIECVRAAIENGADAVYFGLEVGMNARERAKNMSLEELPEVLALLHSRGVLGYITLNTLAFSDELPQIEEYVRQIAAAGTDAVLVQDIGLAKLIKRISPDLSIHASTQMTLTSAECIEVAKQLGIDRVVLSRESSIEEIKKISAKSDVPLEVFVHGALCVAYSGQCLTSESLGGRSANRGQCAQACRLPYELICDDEHVDLGDQKYLLSPQDLAAYELLPALIEAGVCSLKIEGRLKTPEYVANMTRHYRQAIDTAMAGSPVQFSEQQKEEMELSFSRGFSPGWLEGNDHKMLVPALSSAKRGVLLGEVIRSGNGRVSVRLQRGIQRGDGVVFDGDRVESQEEGGRVYEIFQRGQSMTGRVESGIVELAFGSGAIDPRSLYPGQKIWKTDDPQLAKRIRKTFDSPHPIRRLDVDLHVVAAVGELLVVTATTDLGDQCVLRSEEPLAEARKHALDDESLRKQFGRLGGTCYELREVNAEIQGRPMVPFSVLGQLRHQLVEQLDAQRREIPVRVIAESGVLDQMRSELPKSASLTETADEVSESTLHVLCRNLDQLKWSLEHLSKTRADQPSVMAEFQDIREYSDAVAVAREFKASLLLATPRIQKPDEMGVFRAMARHQADGFLVRNLSGMSFCREQEIPMVADFSLNAANELTAEFLVELGATRVTASYDLNRDQLLEFTKHCPTDWLEVVIHQHMPMFHMEHCVFCSVLSPGTNKHNCGRPCDDHVVQLEDRAGMKHTLTADVGCRNTLYNATAQSAAEIVPILQRNRLRHYRVELLNEANYAETERVLQLYGELLSGERTGKQVWSELSASNRVGVTRGSLEERRNPLTII
jgi:putative protease